MSRHIVFVGTKLANPQARVVLIHHSTLSSRCFGLLNFHLLKLTVDVEDGMTISTVESFIFDSLLLKILLIVELYAEVLMGKVHLRV